MSEPTSQQFKFSIPANQPQQRLDVYLAQCFQGKSRSYLQSLIKSGDILVNNATVKASHIISPCEEVSVHLQARPPADVVPEDIELDIVYEDDVLLVVNKSAGMVVHPACGHSSGTLVNALLYRYSDELSTNSGIMRPGIVHRLDKDTSGLLVVAKTDETHAALSQQFSEKTARRNYKTIVWGTPEYESDTISTFITRSPKDRRKMAVVAEGGKWAVTHYKLLEKFHLASYLDVSLETGRTHQIRVHMLSIAHPVLGDPLYKGRSRNIAISSGGNDEKVRGYLKIMRQQALHAFQLRFVHPTQGKEMQFEAPIPGNFKHLLKVLRNENWSAGPSTTS